MMQIINHGSHGFSRKRGASALALALMVLLGIGVAVARPLAALGTVQIAPPAPPSAAPPVPPVSPAPPAAADTDEDGDTIATIRVHQLRHRFRHDDTHQRVSVGHDADLAAGEQADSVVAVLGSASSEGTVSDSVVSVLGNTHVTGPVGDSAVAVLGSTYVNSHVAGDVVAVLGSVELGPQAEIGGDVVAVGGTIHREPGAVVHGEVQQVGPDLSLNLAWMTPWFRHALLYLRPLAIGPGLGWAWAVAGVFLALYLLLAFLAPRGVERCVASLELHPGATLLAALATVLLTPPLLVLLTVTVIGIAAVPVVLLALFCASLFGKAAALAWLGGRVLPRQGPTGVVRVVLAVFIGGLIALAIYLVPVLGLAVYKILGLLGLGMVVHALIVAARQRRQAPHAGGAAPPSSPSPSTVPPAASPGAAAASIEPGLVGATAAAAQPQTGQAQTPQMAAVISPTLPRAGFWIRMAALLIDVVVVGLVLRIVHWNHLILVALAAYGAILWKARGATLGGIVCDLHVVRVDGRPMDWTTAIVRALGCFLSLFAIGLGFLWIAFDENRQAWHDKFAGTVVVRLAKAASPAQA